MELFLYFLNIILLYIYIFNICLYNIYNIALMYYINIPLNDTDNHRVIFDSYISDFRNIFLYNHLFV